MSSGCTINLYEGGQKKVLDNIPCSDGEIINVQTALERSYPMYKVAFVLAYYGSELGYFLQALDGIAETSLTSWFLYEAGSETPVGIDGIDLKAGDAVDFRYEFYADDKHRGTVYERKQAIISSRMRSEE